MKRCMLVLAGVLLFWTASVSAQEWAKARLDNSPRHLEWVTVKHGDREVKCFIAFPEVKEKATAVVVIHEIFGLSNWVRSVTDQLAEAGYLAIAPDLLSGSAPGGGGTAELGGDDGAKGDFIIAAGPGHGRPECDTRICRQAAGSQRESGCGRILLGRGSDDSIRHQQSRDTRPRSPFMERRHLPQKASSGLSPLCMAFMPATTCASMLRCPTRPIS